MDLPFYSEVNGSPKINDEYGEEFRFLDGDVWVPWNDYQYNTATGKFDLHKNWFFVGNNNANPPLT